MMSSHFRDPDWWFAGILGLIVISLIWSYVRDVTAKLVGPLIPAVRRQRDTRLQRDRKQVELLVTNPDLLQMELVRCLYLVVIFLALVGFYLFFSIVGTSLLRLPGMREPGLYDLGLIAEISLVIGAALGFCSIYFGTPITPRLHTVMRARAEYENRCKRQATPPAPSASKPGSPPRS